MEKLHAVIKKPKQGVKKVAKNEENKGNKLPKQFKLEMKTTKRLEKIFFDVACKDLAHNLLGKVLVRKLTNGLLLKGQIVETECYPGGADKASNSYNGRQTPANKPLYMEAGTTFVYLTYGMYHCLNISSAEPGGAVLIRALAPMLNIDKMLELRTSKRKSTSKPLQHEEIANGPSKLCQAMDITKLHSNALDLSVDENFWVETDCESGDANAYSIVETSRIGIDSVGPEWALKPMRFYILGNVHVSKRDLEKEKEVLVCAKKL